MQDALGERQADCLTPRAREPMLLRSMTPIPAWVAPTVAISLVIIAASLLTMGGVALAIGLGLRRKSRAVSAQLTALSTETKIVAARLKHEIDSYADLSVEARGKIKGAIAAVEVRLQDLDALAEVLQEEVQEAGLRAATIVRTVRLSGQLFGVARRAFKRHKRVQGGS
jgi:hypothetical protein